MIDADIVLAVQRATASPLLRTVVGFCARWLIYFSIPLAAVLYRIRAYRGVVIEAAWSVLVAFALSSAFSALIGRVRPFLAVKDVVAVVPPNIQQGSFPSSHTAVAFAIAVALANSHPALGVLVFIAAAIVAFGRIAAGMHFPTDVLAGIAIGMFAVFIVRTVRNAL